MAGTVGKILIQTIFLQALANLLIHLTTADSGSDGIQSDLLSFPHLLINILEALGSWFNTDSPGHIPRITFKNASKIHGHHIAGTNELLTRPSMWQSGIFPRYHNSIKGFPFTTFLS